MAPARASALRVPFGTPRFASCRRSVPLSRSPSARNPRPRLYCVLAQSGGTIRAIGLDRLLGRPADRRLAPLAIALIASRLIAPASKLATARELAANTAASSLGRLLGLGAVDEVELYRALDWLGARSPPPHG